MIEPQKVGCIIPVLETLLDDPEFQVFGMPKMQEDARLAFSHLGTLIEFTMEQEILRAPAGQDFWDEDVYGMRIPTDYVMVRFTALAVPHGEVEFVGGS